MNRGFQINESIDVYKWPLQLVFRGIISRTANEMVSETITTEINIVPFADGVRMASVVVTMVPVM